MRSSTPRSSPIGTNPEIEHRRPVIARRSDCTHRQPPAHNSRERIRIIPTRYSSHKKHNHLDSRANMPSVTLPPAPAESKLEMSPLLPEEYPLYWKVMSESFAGAIMDLM